jgi:hypothetical protein
LADRLVLLKRVEGRWKMHGEILFNPH